MTRRFRTIVATLVTLIAFIGIDTRADEHVISPSTGFQPAHTYSISDIETIDNGTGNLSLHIPITQLPPGPGGFTAGLTLSYNNRIWETEPLVGLSLTTYALRESPSGGWRLTMLPELQFAFVESSGESDPCGYFVTAELFHLMLINPDGSRNRFMLSSPALTMPAACEAGTYRLSQMPTTPTVWYTADGSYLRLEMGALPTGGTWPNDCSWTIHRQDGSKIYFDATTELTYLIDRNGNQIKIEKTAEGVYPYNKHETMTDAFGRSIRLDHYVGRDEVSQTGHNGQTLTWKIYYGSVGSITPISYICDHDVMTSCAFETPPQMATQLLLPNGLSYYFGYSPTTQTQSNYRELRTVTLPTGAVAEYGYWLDSISSAVPYYFVLANTIASKKVSMNGVCN